MSIIRPGNEKFHYSDGSHKWIPPDPDYDQAAWDEQVRRTRNLIRPARRQSIGSGFESLAAHVLL
ncbi:hypothetical protein FF096_11550 [Micromonospora sp. CP22]|nr:hypothetical protein [Micromonospora sp. CP22]